MTKLRLFLAVLFALSAEPSAACHRFTRWRYPWPQRCGISTQPGYVVSRAPIVLPPIRLGEPEDAEEIPLAALSLVDVLGGDDDAELALVMLHHAKLDELRVRLGGSR